MPFSHHSHSKDYIAHGSGPLDEVVEAVLKQEFHTFCFSEHMPRLSSKYLYPEEIADKSDTNFLKQQFDNYLHKVLTIKKTYKDSSTNFIIGTECECADSEHISYAKSMFDNYYKGKLQYLVGSIHHVNSVPIDYDIETFEKAIVRADNSFLEFLKDYFNLQYTMLTELKPLVVGHFDLPCLFIKDSKLRIDKDTGKVLDEMNFEKKDSFISINEYDIDDYIFTVFKDSLYPLVERNLKFIIDNNLALEINTSGLRKKLKYPYPSIKLAVLFKQLGGKFVLSDDSHGLNQLGTNYLKCKEEYIKGALKLDTIYYLKELTPYNPESLSLPEVKLEPMDIKEFNELPYWSNIK
ncbi:histidinol phosphate phosphatase H [Hanseniaspora valbyensis NRRL Y-1626]|uniref:Histidinol-phosphatase n=1 Tax=Hanseniaspora valbyensis NRRL Y-1626 TaxID=766949 RepID=A0A1B7TKB0_9ASCO|nr:histidinol phosphate phosphatase H [Hanseniaspora valbyensis NRRL Y-1626]